MRTLLGWWRRLRGGAPNAARDADLTAEIESHIQMHVADCVRRGMTPAEARRDALLAIGGVEAAKEGLRDQRGFRWLNELVFDLRFAARRLARDARFTFVVVAVLAAGMGVSAMQLTIVNAHCFRGLPIDRASRVVFISARDADGRERGLSFSDFAALQDAGTLPGLAAYAGGPLAIGDEDRAPDRVIGAYVSPSTFEVAGLRPLIGRTFHNDDDRTGAAPTVILGHAVWKARYAGDQGIIGRSVNIAGVPTMVIGVMPAAVRFPNNADIWQPLALMPGRDDAPRPSGPLSVFARLADDATLVGIRGRVQALANELRARHPTTHAGAGFTVVAINDRFNARATDTVWLAFLIVGLLVLAIACANAANLLLMRGARRSREFGVRLALGATRGRLVRQSLAESLILGALAAASGLLLSQLGVRLFASLIPENGLPYWVSYTIDGRVLLFVISSAFLAVLCFGLVPALRLARTDANCELRAGTRVQGNTRLRRWTAAFVSVEFGLTVVLLTSVVVGVRASWRAGREGTVINTSGVTTGWITLSDRRYDTAEARHAFYDAVRERLDALAGVGTSSVMSALPFGGAPERAIEIDGRPAAGDSRMPSAQTVTIDEHYFATFAIGPVEGRGFNSLDGTAGREAAIVNQRFAALHFNGENPIGRRIRLVTEQRNDGGAWLTIVGVSPAVRQRASSDPDPVVYIPIRQAPPSGAAFAIRGAGAAPDATTALRDMLRTIDPNLPMYRIGTLDRFLAEAGWNGRLSQQLLTAIALIAVLLSTAGLYAVTAYAVSHRIPEIGLRIAFGARPPSIAWLVLRRALVHIGAGLLVGAVFAVVWVRLFFPADAGGQQSPTDPMMTFALVAGLLIVVGVLACLSPIRTALRVDPVIALRQE